MALSDRRYGGRRVTRTCHSGLRTVRTVRLAADRDRHARADPCSQPARVQIGDADAAVGRSCPGYAADVRQAVNCDLAGAAVELLEDVRASRESERERLPG